MGTYVPWTEDRVAVLCYRGVGGMEQGGWVASRLGEQGDFLPTSTGDETRMLLDRMCVSLD